MNEWPMSYAVTVIFEAEDSAHAADVLDRCSQIAGSRGKFEGGWGEPYGDPAAALPADGTADAE